MRIRSLLLIWAVMLALLALSVGVTLLPIGPWKQAIGLLAAAAKAGLILWLFMDLRRADGLTRLAAGAALCFLAIFGLLLSTDILTRTWLGG